MSTVNKVVSTDMQWNANFYDTKHDFVFKYGEDLVNLLNPQPGETILDLGCGTGYLTNVIAQSGAKVLGIDNSSDMIRKAEAEYPQLDFEVRSATDFYYDDPFDAVFSNAVLHWILEGEKAADCIYKNLKSGGRFVLEMGGKDNVKSIIDALKKVLIQHGYATNAATQIWFFPSLGTYTSLLESKGFAVDYAVYYSRETELRDNHNGIKDWIKMFGKSFLQNINEEELDVILSRVQEILRPTNFRDGKWYADYKRLRIVATKP